MIPDSFINEQLEKSRQEKYTAPFIRRFVFQVVDKALRLHYGNNYSSCCLQSSAAIKQILNRFGISAKLFSGSLCVIEIFQTGNQTGWAWGGFWNSDHHIFTLTEYSDLIDLTISQLYQHPHNNIKDSFPIHPFWWTPINKWPPLIKYLPERPIDIELPDLEMQDFNNFLKRVNDITDDFLKNSTSDDILFFPIISGIDSLNELTELGDPWLFWSRKIVEKGVDFPEWIIQKENEIRKNLAVKPA
jgi:hypothetical protein